MVIQLLTITDAIKRMPTALKVTGAIAGTGIVAAGAFGAYRWHEAGQVKRRIEAANLLTSGEMSMEKLRERGEIVTSLKQVMLHSLGGSQGALGLMDQWVKDASSRVFTEVERSVLELVVNGGDAQIDEPVGQFGLGFFSTLPFLKEGCCIVVESQEYVVELRAHPNDPHDALVTFKPAPMRNGTKISIVANRPFTQQRLDRVAHFMSYAQFNQKWHVMGYGNPEGPEVTLSLAPSAIVVEDTGCGITFDHAIHKFLVTSASTKRGGEQATATPTPPSLVDWDGSDKPHLLIVVNGLVVVTREMEGTQSVVIDMPQATNVALARNAIEMKALERQHLTQVIRLAAESLDGELLSNLYQGLVA